MTGENAVLLDITGPGNADAYGDVGTPGTAVWTGRAPCHLQRVKRRVVSGGIVTPVETDVVTVNRRAGAPVAEIPGDQETATTILIEDRRTRTPVRRRFRVVGVENRASGSRADSVRLELDDERTA